MVEQIAGPAEKLLPQLEVVLTAPEEVGDREELGVGERDQEVLAQEDVELGGVQAADALVVEGEVQDDEEVLGVLVDLRPLPLGEHVLDVELVEAEALGEKRDLERAGPLGVDSGQPVSGELGDARLGPLDDVARGAAGSSAPKACERGPCHRYSAVRPVASRSTRF